MVGEEGLNTRSVENEPTKSWQADLLPGGIRLTMSEQKELENLLIQQVNEWLLTRNAPPKMIDISETDTEIRINELSSLASSLGLANISVLTKIPTNVELEEIKRSGEPISDTPYDTFTPTGERLGFKGGTSPNFPFIGTRFSIPNAPYKFTNVDTKTDDTVRSICVRSLPSTAGTTVVKIAVFNHRSKQWIKRNGGSDIVMVAEMNTPMSEDKIPVLLNFLQRFLPPELSQINQDEEINYIDFGM